MTVVRRETNGWRWPLFMVAYLFSFAKLRGTAPFAKRSENTLCLIFFVAEVDLCWWSQDRRWSDSQR